MSGLSAPRIVFGVHSMSPFNRTTGMPYGILKVIAGGTLTLNASIDSLYGGSSRFAWAAESKTIAADMSAKVKAYPGFLFTLWLGASVTDNGAEAAASVTTLTNKLGTSVKVATTGIASVAITSGNETNVKFAKYVAIATDATHVDVYKMSDVDAARGSTADSYVNDLLKITTSPIVITTGAVVVVIPNTGLQFVGGSGTIALVTGDTATFSSRPENTASSDIVIGAANASFPNFGCVLLAQKRATGEMFEITANNVVGVGMPLPMSEMAFSETDVKFTLLYDSGSDSLATIRTVTPSTFN